MKHYLNYFGFFTLVILMIIAITSHTKTLFITMFKHLKSVLLLCSIAVIFLGCKLKPQPKSDTTAKTYHIHKLSHSIVFKPAVRATAVKLNKVHLSIKPAVKHLGIIDKTEFKSNRLIKSKMGFVMGTDDEITAAGPSVNNGFFLTDSAITTGKVMFTNPLPNWWITYNISDKSDTLHLNANRLIKLNDSTFVVK